MNSNLQFMILESMQKSNILPITSNCNVNCVFCSHQNNPTQVNVYTHPPRKIEEIKESLDFLDGKRKIIIGESATKINEGEPFSHPEIIDILAVVRKRFPETLIAITTNGSLLSEEIVSKLKGLEPIELNISLNSSDCEMRFKIMADKYSSVAQKAIPLLKKYQIAFNGSIVALPWITGWQDLEDTVLYLDRFGAETIRVFLPGYTKLTEDKMKFPKNLWSELTSWADELDSKLSSVLLTEPPAIKSLIPEIKGVIAGTPAQFAGILAGDIIKSVGGVKPHTRVEAFRLLENCGTEVISLIRRNKEIELTLEKKQRQAPGVVMEYDLDWSQMMELATVITKRGVNSVLVLTSVLAREIITMGAKKLNIDKCVNVHSVPSKFFGGNIATAGLLTVEDFLCALKSPQLNINDCQFVVLPQVAFDGNGKDLTGRPYWEIGELLGVEVMLV